ncbi:MAG: S8 family serine peptidase [Thermotogae bacterium]|nr:S8 family serine peptidase [Thermotogota bacterium]
MLPFWVYVQSKDVPYAEIFSLYRRTKSTWLGTYSFYWFADTSAQPDNFHLNPSKERVTTFRVRRSSRKKPANPLFYSYGESERQVKAVKADTLHALGVTGEGVKIGIFDTGFDLDHPALLGVKVAKQMDFNSGDRLMWENMEIPPPVAIPFYLHSYDCDTMGASLVCLYSGADEKALQGINTRTWNLYLYVLYPDSSWELHNVQAGYEYNPSIARWDDSLFVAWTYGFGSVKLAVVDTVLDTLINIRILPGYQKVLLEVLRDTLVVGAYTGDSVKLCYYDRASGLECWNSTPLSKVSGMYLWKDTLFFSDGDSIYRMDRANVVGVEAGFYPVYAEGNLAFIRNDTAYAFGRPIVRSDLLSDIGFNGRVLAVPMADNINLYDSTGQLLGTYGWTGCDKPSFVGGGLVFRARGDTIAEPPPVGTGYYHGTRVLSVLAGYVDGRLVGIAPGATYYLAKTEKVARTDTSIIWENRIEEDFLVSALEWAARSGVQIANISLGYGADLGYTKDMMDGNTALSSRVVSKSLERGMLVVAAMGNVGSRPIPDPNVGDTTLTAPADAYNIVAVSGAIWDSVTSSWMPANQSAFGPSADGRLKPEVIAPFTVVAIDDTFSLVTVSGTSYSAPLVVGALALALQVHPSWSLGELRENLLKTATPLLGYTAPNFVTGYGMPDAYALATLEPFETEVEVLKLKVASVYPNPFSKSRNKKLTILVESPYPADYVEVKIFSASGTPIKTLKLNTNLSVGLTPLSLDVANLPEGLYFVSILTERGWTTGKFVVIK